MMGEQNQLTVALCATEQICWDVTRITASRADSLLLQTRSNKEKWSKKTVLIFPKQ